MIYIVMIILVLLLGYFVIDSRASAHQPRKGRDHCMRLPVAHVYADEHMTCVGEREENGKAYRLWVEELSETN